MLADDIDHEVTRVLAEKLEHLNLSDHHLRLIARTARAAAMREIETAGLAPMPYDPSMKMVAAGKDVVGYSVDSKIIAAMWRAMAAVAPKFSDE
jgi:hypothetical protein